MPWVYNELKIKKRLCGEPKKPDARIGHVAVCIDHKQLMVFGGGNKGEHFVGDVWFYDIAAGLWWSEQSKGEIPRTTTDSASWLHCGHVYIFGGYHGLRYSNDVHALNIATLEWEKCEPRGTPPTPRHGAVCWHLENCVMVFGGFGGAPKDMQDYDEYLRYNDTHSSGWNNQLHVLDLNTDTGGMEWTKPRCTGKPPSPRTLPAHARFERTAYLFGGWCGSLRFNDMFMLDLNNLEWEQMNINPRAHPTRIPRARYGSSMSVFSDGTIFVCGGRDDYMKHLSECWVLHPKGSKRLEVSKVRVRELRGVYAHSACVVVHTDGKEVVYLFGGEDSSKKAIDTIGYIGEEEDEVDEDPVEENTELETDNLKEPENLEETSSKIEGEEGIE